MRAMYLFNRSTCRSRGDGYSDWAFEGEVSLKKQYDKHVRE